ncbi:MAG: hypothetical protein FWD40_08950 [Treponema sp.]|nr:hypothetical protein [Treponema sp.]
MRHLFIINPVAKGINGKTKPLRDKITRFFSKYPDIRYDIFESRWCRDSLIFIRRYISEPNETVRIHSIGGNGTLFEVVNSIVGLENVEVAGHPYGSANAFLRYFGPKSRKHLLSLESQVFDKTIPLDIIRCGNNYGLGFALTGMEAFANMKGDEWILKGLPEDIAYTLAAVVRIMAKKAGQKYNVEIDGTIIEGDFISIMAANAPCYGKAMHAAVDSHPDNGILDVYVFKNASRLRLLSNIPVYIKGGYKKIPDLVSHYKAKKIKLSSNEVMCMSIDGQTLYGTSIEYEIIPRAINFVCPNGIDLSRLPLVFGKPKEGYRI